MEFNKKINIGSFVISEESPALIIAEAGVNHNGDMRLAMELIDCAVQAKVDAVKFQTFKAEHLILKNVAKAPYQKKTTIKQQSQFDMLKELEISLNNIRQLKKYCEKRKITFLITPFDEVSLDELNSIDVAALKIASTDITNLPFLIKAAKKAKPIILSTGMSYLWEVEAALKSIYPFNRDIILLQCTANYPIKDEEANLKVVQRFRDDFNILAGYSDHTTGIGASPYAVAMGAKVIEKHFTIDKKQKGPDHKASLSPKELLAFVKEIRRVEKYIGAGVKEPTVSEQLTRRSLQKCFVALKTIQKGEALGEHNLTAKRTGGEGISPVYYKKIFGKRAMKDYAPDEIIEV